MLSNSSKKTLLEQLTNASFRLSQVILAADSTTEGFSKSYLNDKESFNQMIASGIKMERMLKKYFRDQADYIIMNLNWYAYEGSIKAGADPIGNDIYAGTINWEGQKLSLQIEFNNGMAGAFIAGMAAAHTEVGIATQVLPTDAPAIKALYKYGLNRAKLITDTTKERVKASLANSLKLGLDKNQAAEALQEIIDDPARASLIAHTEQVQAFSEGRQLVGEQLGAREKTWDNGQASACPSCQELHGQTVKFDDTFSSDKYGEVDYPPLHPRCYCGWHMVL